MKPITLIGLGAFLILASCGGPSTKKQEASIQDSCVSDTTARAKFSLYFNAKAKIDTSAGTEKRVLATDSRTVTLHVGTFNCYDETKISKSQAERALQLASEILNSSKFRLQLTALDFKYINHCSVCSGGTVSKPERIPGKIVLDSLLRKAQVTLNLNISAGRCGRGLGATCPNTNDVSSKYLGVSCDMPNLPIEYAYAVHICHEFSHTVGYCHTDHSDDVAEKIGWIAYYIAVEMHNRT